MAQTIVHLTDETVDVHGGMDVDGVAVLSDTLTAGATTFSSTVTVSGQATLNKLALVQTLVGTSVNTWVGGTVPVIGDGQVHFTFTAGASTFRVPVWPAA
jgi:hypothetical protein